MQGSPGSLQEILVRVLVTGAKIDFPIEDVDDLVAREAMLGVGVEVQ